jgi:hypothetical protein
MGRIVPPFRQLYQETVSDVHVQLKAAALADLGYKSAFDPWTPEVSTMVISPFQRSCDKLNIIGLIHLRKLIATLVRELNQRL